MTAVQPRNAALSRLLACSCFAVPAVAKAQDGGVKVAKAAATPAIKQAFNLPETIIQCTPLQESLPALAGEGVIGCAPAFAEVLPPAPAEAPPAEAVAEPAAADVDAEDVAPLAPATEAATAAVEEASADLAPAPAAATSSPCLTGRASSQSPPRSLPSRPPSRSPLPNDVAEALCDLQAAQPADAIWDLNVIRAAATHTPSSLELGAVVPPLLRAMRAPRLGTARAAIITLKELFSTYGDALADHVADDSSPTSSVVLALLQKATGRDINSRRIAADADACLIAMVEALTPQTCISILQNHSLPSKGHGHVRSKAACVLLAAAYKLAATTPADFDLDVSSNLLRISEALLAGGAACRHAAEKLAAVCRCAWGERAHPDAPDGKEGWAVLLRLTVEPAAAVAISQAIDGFGGQGREMVGGSGLPVWAEEHPLGEVIGHLVMGDE